VVKGKKTEKRESGGGLVVKTMEKGGAVKPLVTC